MASKRRSRDVGAGGNADKGLIPSKRKPKPTSRRGIATLFGFTREAARDAAARARDDEKNSPYDMIGHLKTRGYRYKRTGTHKTGEGLYNQYGPDGRLMKTGLLHRPRKERRPRYGVWTLAQANVARDRRSGQFIPRRGA